MRLQIRKFQPFFSDASKDLIAHLFDLTSKIQKTQAPVSEILDQVRIVSSDYSQFKDFLDKNIVPIPGNLQVELLVRKKVTIFGSMKLFVDSLQGYSQNTDNFLARTLVGIRSSGIIRAIGSLEPSPPSISTLTTLRPYVSELVTAFFPCTLR